MFKNLIKFEWLFFVKKKSIYAMAVFYLVLGFFTAAAANFPFENTYKNSPYVLNYLLGIISLMCIFSTTILAGQSLFRERDANFDTILFAAPLRKAPYVLSRLLIIFTITVFCYLTFVCGLMAGHLLEGNGNDQFGPFRLWNYLHPFLLLLVPNILFCTAAACTIGLVTKNKMLVYVSGIFIYFLYWGVALFSGSPLMASAAPASAQAMSWSAILDPFGLSAFFEQTRFWTAAERNTQLLALTGNLLINRSLYLLLSAGLLAFAYHKFSFAIDGNKSSKGCFLKETTAGRFAYKTFSTQTSGTFYGLKSIWSFLKIDLAGVIKTVPLWIICVGWAGFLLLEVLTTIDGNARIPELFASSGIIVKSILEGLPPLGLIVLLFYGSEVFWRSQTSRFSAFEETTPVNTVVSMISKTLTLAFVAVILIALSIATGVGIQLIFNNSDINWKLYLSLFYLIGLPLALCAALIISVQAFVRNRYLGIVFAGLLLAVTNTSIGFMVGFKHSLLRFANAFQGNYSEQNGFGSSVQAFDMKMIYWLCVTLIIFIAAAKFLNFGSVKSFFTPKLNWISPSNILLILCIAGAAFAGNVIYRNTKMTGRAEINDWKQAYEEKYEGIKGIPQPIITDVKTAIDLFPESESYQVAGEYVLANKTALPITTLYISADKDMQWSDWQLENGSLHEQDEVFGLYTFVLDQPLLSGKTAKLKFRFKYSGSPYNSPTASNTMIGNGSFVRISNYFPRFGYNTDIEIDDPRERATRKLPVSNTAIPLDEKRSEPFEYGFINYDAVISTSKDQTAIGVGELRKQWEENGRNYFQYTTENPVPFRFAVSSARYAVKKAVHNNINIEVYYHPQHFQNIDHLIMTAKETLDYCEQNIDKYPFKTLRFIEISSFTRGFAGTAYPTDLFINENFGFQNKVDKNPDKDILHEMVSHELSHMWWGNSKIDPEYREGSKILTETLAMYTELMTYKKTYGEGHLLSRVNVHKDLYLSQRAFADEEPLYRSAPQKPYLAYDKGMVVMYQMYKLLGEEKINRALKTFYGKYGYPNQPPVSTDLINEFYAVADKKMLPRIDELFKQIVTYDLSLNSVAAAQNADGSYTVDIEASAVKFIEDGKGNSEKAAFTETIEAAFYFADEKKQIVTLKSEGKTTFTLPEKPKKITLDPEGKYLDRTSENNERNF